MVTIKKFLVGWQFFAALAIPLILLPMVFQEAPDIVEEAGTRPGTKYRCAYVILVMALYWGLEVIPLPITSLLPLVMFPLLGVRDSYSVSENYTKESNMIFLGGVIVALAVEYCNLHRRIALLIMRLLGTSPIWLLFGVMASTAFLSMWISSTTCVALLVPLAIAIIDEIYESSELNLDTTRNPTIVISLPGSPADTRRPSAVSNATTNSAGIRAYNRQRRKSTMFENSAMEGFHRRRSHGDTARSKMLSPRVSVAPFYGMRHSDAYLNVLREEPPRPLQLSIVMNELASERRMSTAPSMNSTPTSRRKVVGFVGDQDEIKSIASSFLNALEEVEQPTEAELKEEEERGAKIKKMYLFAMAYSANIGGTAVITGTAPNKVFKEVIKLVDLTQGGKYRNMTFFTWMALNLPPMIINILIAWVYLIFKYHGIPNWRSWFVINCFFKTSKENKLANEKLAQWKSRVKSYLQREYVLLGPITFHEMAVAAIFLWVVFLWIFRDPEFFPGWKSLIKGSKSGDSTAAMLGVVLLFICPRDFSFLFGSNDKATYEALLDWKFVSAKLPWGVLLLLGSGFAISDAADYSGLSDSLGDRLRLLEDLSKPGLLLVVILITSLITEVTSSAACANILLPIMLSVSKSMKIHPLFLTVACAVTCSYAFLLPVAAPSNAIVFAAGNFSTLEMIKNGFFLNVICIAVLYVSTLTYGEWMFNFSDYEYGEETEVPH